uniref:Uncharacterized protein n=1 Tax=Myotis myotis TaxID=51298 RepID=A0A7J7SCG9_MYOMY|nr:hypothetical protein mMyoMyo1_009484 [Myotis myotis]
MPRMQARSPVGGNAGGSGSMTFLSHQCFYLFIPLPSYLSLKKNKSIKTYLKKTFEDKSFILLLLFFLERVKGRGRDREKHLCERKHIDCLPPAHTLTRAGEPATEVCTLDLNRTWDPSGHRLMFYSLSQTV